MAKSFYIRFVIAILIVWETTFIRIFSNDFLSNVLCLFLTWLSFEACPNNIRSTLKTWRRRRKKNMKDVNLSWNGSKQSSASFVQTPNYCCNFLKGEIKKVNKEIVQHFFELDLIRLIKLSWIFKSKSTKYELILILFPCNV